MASEWSHPIRVAILVKDFPPDSLGGLETQTLWMARELNQRDDCKVTVYTKSYNRNELEERGFQIVRIPHLRNRPGRGISFKALSTAALIRDSDRYDVIQCMQLNPYGFLGYIVHQFTGVPYFVWMREGYKSGKFNWFSQWKANKIFNSTTVVSQTQKTKDDVLKDFPNAKIRVLGNGVDIPSRKAKGNNVIYLGRLSADKGVDNLIRAVAGTDESLLVIGDGPEREHLQLLAESLDVAAQFVGYVPPEDVTKYLLKGKLLVLPTTEHIEGMPNAILEAMAVGLPVIATDIGGTRELIVSGETGLILQPRDVAELEKSISRLCTDDARRNRMGMNARQYIEDNHDWQSIVKQLIHIYRDVIKENQ